MKNWKILIAEDDDNIRLGLCDALADEGAEPTGAEDGRVALDLFVKEQNFDLVILDVMMPKLSGYDVCRELRKHSEVPIIMLTAKGEEIDKVVGLRLGADDYITKPFGIHELFARIDAVMRRCNDGKSADVSKHHREFREKPFEFGRLMVDPEALRGDDGEQRIDLTPRELEIIRYFHERPGRAISREDLMHAVWGYDYHGTTRTVDQHIAQVRKKVEGNSGSTPRTIVTVHGFGYRYEPI